MKLYLEKWVIFSFVPAFPIMLESDILPHHVSQWSVELPKVPFNNKVLHRAEQAHTASMTIEPHDLVFKSTAAQNRAINVGSVETTRTWLVTTNTREASEIGRTACERVVDERCLNNIRWCLSVE